MITEINPHPLPRSNVFRWASPMIWNGALRNYQRAFMRKLSEPRMTDEARENILAAITMVVMEGDANA
jgi:hypothetical protein